MAMERLSESSCSFPSAGQRVPYADRAIKQARPFQADFVTHYKLPDGRVVNSNGHYYRNSRGLVREDTGTSGQITDLNARTVTLLNHQLKTAVIYKIPHLS